MPEAGDSGQSSGQSDAGKGGDPGTGSGQPPAGEPGKGAPAAAEITADKALELVQEAMKQTGPDGQPFDPQRALETIRKLRPYEDEAGKLRSELEAANAKLKEHENAKLSETERRDQRISELETENSGLKTDLADLQNARQIEEAATKANATNPAAVYRLIDHAAIKVKDGKVENADELVADAAKKFPELFQGGRPPGSADGGPRGPIGSGEDMNAIIRSAAGRTT